MLKLFKTNIAIIPIIFIISILVFFRLDVYFSGFTINLWEGELAPFSNFFKYLLGNNLLLNPLFNLSISSLIVFIQSGLIMSILSKFKTKKDSFLYSWIFVLLMHLFPEYTFLSPQLFSLTFLLLAIRKIIIFSEKNKEKKLLFEFSLLFGVAIMFWMPSVIFLFVFLIYLNSFLNIDFKVLLSIFFTASIPIIYAVAYYVFYNEQQSILPVFNSLEFNQFDFQFYSLSKLLSSIVVCCYFLFSILSVTKYFDRELNAFKAFLFFLFVFVFNVLIVLVFQNENTFSTLMFLYFPLSILLSMFFNRIKPKPLAEFAHLILLLTIIINFMYFT